MELGTEFKTKEQALAFLKRAGLLKQHRVITGEEREKVFTMLRLLPSKHTNNQHLWYETWQVGNITYNHVIGDGVDELVEITENESAH